MSALSQSSNLPSPNGSRPLRDSHNCYPYDGKWNDRVDRALGTGFPVAIEQDLAWYVDPASGKGQVVVNHSEKATAVDPEERQYFFQRVRPIIENELAHGDPAKWPVIVLHFDFKDNQTPLLEAVWKLLGDYEPWISTAVKSDDPHKMTEIARKPLLVLTEDSDLQEKVFYDAVPVGARLRLFGSARTRLPQSTSKAESEHLLATTPPEDMLPEKPTTYRRWWNNSWHEVEEGGQPKAGAWTDSKMARLQALAARAHSLGYWIRFYTLDGFTPEQGKQNGWFESYNFGSLESAQQRWRAALDAGVDLIATDQYEDLAAFMKKNGRR
ncbi:MAG TPA: hypothetical protein VH302_01855 [Bryobacteraceae bacterium]|nr:hypothetical protein [Bryobacteraceae bacterium]